MKPKSAKKTVDEGLPQEGLVKIMMEMMIVIAMMMMMHEVVEVVVVVRAGVRVKDCLPIGIIGRQLRDTDQTMGYAATTITICFALLNVYVIKHLEACAQNLYIQKVC